MELWCETVRDKKVQTSEIKNGKDYKHIPNFILESN